MDLKKLFSVLIFGGSCGLIASLIWCYIDYSPSRLNNLGYYLELLATGKLDAYTTGANVLFWISLVISGISIALKVSVVKQRS